MAEASIATRNPLLYVDTDEAGLHLRVSRELVPAVGRFLASEARRRAFLVQRAATSNTWPASPTQWAGLVTVIVALLAAGDPLAQALDPATWPPRADPPGAPQSWQLAFLACAAHVARVLSLAVASALAAAHMVSRMLGGANMLLTAVVCGTMTFVLVSWLQRRLLSAVLSYTGWALRAHGERVPLWERAWGAAVSVLSYGRPLTHSFDALIPRQPLPSLEDTVRRWLRSVRPLLPPADYARAQKSAEAFARGKGRKFQVACFIPLFSSFFFFFFFVKKTFHG
jgi:hypothetical protein